MPTLIETREPNEPSQATGNDVVNYIHTEFSRRRGERMVQELKWQLSSAFYSGEQYLEIDTQLMKLAPAPMMTKDESRHIFDETSSTVDTLCGLLARGKHKTSVRSYKTDREPTSDEVQTQQEKVRLSQNIVTAAYEKQRMQKQKELAIWQATILGDAFFKVIWNKNAGLRVELDGEAVTSGDMETVLVPAHSLYPDTDTVSLEKQEKLMQVSLVSKEWALRNYGKHCPELHCLKPEAHREIKIRNIDPNQYTTDMLPQQGTGRKGFAKHEQAVRNSCVLYEEWEKPSTSYPNGRYIVVCDDILVYDIDLPKLYRERFPFIQYNLNNTDTFFSDSVVTKLIPVQRALNNVMNRMMDYQNRVAFGSYFAYENSFVDTKQMKVEQRDGRVVMLKEQSPVPTPQQIAPMPNSIMEIRNALLETMTRISGISDYARTSTVSPYASGAVLEQISTSDNTRIGTMLRNLDYCLQEVTSWWLKTYRAYARGQMLMEFAEGDAISAVRFVGSDIEYLNTYVETEIDLQASGKNAITTAVTQGGFLNDPLLGQPSTLAKKAFLQMWGVYDQEGMPDAVQQMFLSEQQAYKLKELEIAAQVQQLKQQAMQAEIQSTEAQMGMAAQDAQIKAGLVAQQQQLENAPMGV